MCGIIRGEWNELLDEICDDREMHEYTDRELANLQDEISNVATITVKTCWIRTDLGGKKDPKCLKYGIGSMKGFLTDLKNSWKKMM